MQKIKHQIIQAIIQIFKPTNLTLLAEDTNSLREMYGESIQSQLSRFEIKVKKIRQMITDREFLLLINDIEKIFEDLHPIEMEINDIAAITLETTLTSFKEKLSKIEDQKNQIYTTCKTFSFESVKLFDKASKLEDSLKGKLENLDRHVQQKFLVTRQNQWLTDYIPKLDLLSEYETNLDKLLMGFEQSSWKEVIGKIAEIASLIQEIKRIDISDQTIIATELQLSDRFQLILDTLYSIQQKIEIVTLLLSEKYVLYVEDKLINLSIQVNHIERNINLSVTDKDLKVVTDTIQDLFDQISEIDVNLEKNIYRKSPNIKSIPKIRKIIRDLFYQLNLRNESFTIRLNKIAQVTHEEELRDFISRQLKSIEQMKEEIDRAFEFSYSKSMVNTSLHGIVERIDSLTKIIDEGYERFNQTTKEPAQDTLQQNLGSLNILLVDRLGKYYINYLDTVFRPNSEQTRLEIDTLLSNLNNRQTKVDTNFDAKIEKIRQEIGEVIIQEFTSDSIHLSLLANHDVVHTHNAIEMELRNKFTELLAVVEHIKVVNNLSIDLSRIIELQNDLLKNADLHDQLEQVITIPTGRITELLIDIKAGQKDLHIQTSDLDQKLAEQYLPEHFGTLKDLEDKIDQGIFHLEALIFINEIFQLDNDVKRLIEFQEQDFIEEGFLELNAIFNTNPINETMEQFDKYVENPLTPFRPELAECKGRLLTNHEKFVELKVTNDIKIAILELDKFEKEFEEIATDISHKDPDEIQRMGKSIYILAENLASWEIEQHTILSSSNNQRLIKGLSLLKGEIELFYDTLIKEYKKKNEKEILDQIQIEFEQRKTTTTYEFDEILKQRLENKKEEIILTERTLVRLFTSYDTLELAKLALLIDIDNHEEFRLFLMGLQQEIPAFQIVNSTLSINSTEIGKHLDEVISSFNDWQLESIREKVKNDLENQIRIMDQEYTDQMDLQIDYSDIFPEISFDALKTKSKRLEEELKAKELEDKEIDEKPRTDVSQEEKEEEHEFDELSDSHQNIQQLKMWIESSSHISINEFSDKLSFPTVELAESWIMDVSDLEVISIDDDYLIFSHESASQVNRLIDEYRLTFQIPITGSGDKPAATEHGSGQQIVREKQGQSSYEAINLGDLPKSDDTIPPSQLSMSVSENANIQPSDYAKNVKTERTEQNDPIHGQPTEPYKASLNMKAQVFESSHEDQMPNPQTPITHHGRPDPESHISPTGGYAGAFGPAMDPRSMMIPDNFPPLENLEDSERVLLVCKIEAFNHKKSFFVFTDQQLHFIGEKTIGRWSGGGVIGLVATAVSTVGSVVDKKKSPYTQFTFSYDIITRIRFSGMITRKMKIEYLVAQNKVSKLELKSIKKPDESDMIGVISQFAPHVRLG